jgi:SAM-dependent methyltransferase
MSSYKNQARGVESDYDRYLRGMDASMRQKVALTAAHLLCEGQIADMGMGSGTGSYSLAALYPSLDVIGVDINQEMIDIAAQKYSLPNLRFQQGDIAEQCFANESLEAILNSSVLHHVTSFNGYKVEAAGRAIGNQFRQLSEGGILIIRDFLLPEDGVVWLDLPTDDHPSTPLGSSVDLFYRFATEFRSLHSEKGFVYREINGTKEKPLAPGWKRFEVQRRFAVEFVLRKDYRRDWVLEAQEEYCYYTQSQFERLYHSLGLRVLASTPIRNPWIVENRFKGHFRWYDRSGEELDWPATNYLIIGQKIGKHFGVGFQSKPTNRIGFLQDTYWKHKQTGVVFDLVHRSGDIVDVLPWYQKDGSIFVLARRSYPRPILGLGESLINDASRATWVTEPLNVSQNEQPIGMAVEDGLRGFIQLDVNDIIDMSIRRPHFPSPGGLMEMIQNVHVEILPVLVDKQLTSGSGFSTSGSLRSIEARQLLRAAQVGALPDSRLELYVYDLLFRLERDVGAWIGGSISQPPEQSGEITNWEDIISMPSQRSFERVSREESNAFLHIAAHQFDELDRNDKVINSVVLESIRVNPLSSSTISCGVISVVEGQLVLGVDMDSRPAAQAFLGNSVLPVSPAWRLPNGIAGFSKTKKALQFVQDKLCDEYGVESQKILPLGGRYHPAPGLTSEVVHPYVVVVDSITDAKNELLWVPLQQLVQSSNEIVDGHLRLLSLRIAHGLNLLT